MSQPRKKLSGLDLWSLVLVGSLAFSTWVHWPDWRFVVLLILGGGFWIWRVVVRPQETTKPRTET